MVKCSRTGVCKTASHQLFKDRAKNRVEDLQTIFANLQSARKESRTIDVSVLEEQVHRMLCDWKAELNEPSPASSLQQGGSLGFSFDICRMFKLYEEEDDATSALVALKPDPDAEKVECHTLVDEYKSTLAVTGMGIENIASQNQVDYNFLQYPTEFGLQDISGLDSSVVDVEDNVSHGRYELIFPPPCAFLGPKCALWDCPRPALCFEWSQTSDNYCSIYHSELASSEGYPGRPPIVRPGGIGLKDNLLFAALDAKALRKDVGIPECEGAATAKSPWNAPELFDLAVWDCETIREWLFFDKPRRAFESGSRKQRSLPDYNGRGWHESRKQVMNEFSGLKRSYYMDPQPMEKFEWHLYEYEVNGYDSCALYRLEVKRVAGKKMSKGKLSNDSVANLQTQMKRLTAEFPDDKQRNGKGRVKNSVRARNGDIYSTSNALVHPVERFEYVSGAPYDYLIGNTTGCYNIN